MNGFEYHFSDVLPPWFYGRDTVLVARELLGKVLVHNSREGLTAGMIVETEAYIQGDPACHAYRGMTPRNRAMFGPPGRAYIYFIYGMHYCFNVVTSREGVGEAVLIRALEPLAGFGLMRGRRGREELPELCSGPAKLVKAMGIDPCMYGHDLTSEPLVIVKGIDVEEERVATSARIGIKDDARLPLRYLLKDSLYVSKRLLKKSAPYPAVLEVPLFDVF